METAKSGAYRTPVPVDSALFFEKNTLEKYRKLILKRWYPEEWTILINFRFMLIKLIRCIQKPNAPQKLILKYSGIVRVY